MAKKKTTKTAKKKTKPTTQPKDFQSIIFALQKFWADWGCTIWQPYNEKVGAGTMNPATFLRVLGPEPWNVAYVEPSVRPDDGRYGENPNRMQQHYQFQVILKPDPGNPQEIYLDSLQAAGVDLRKHDIRFVEDNWASPALGAWGLGWEVWLDGLEITQFTYFQQAGGISLDPVSVEITYGLDRIAMALQNVREVGDVRWITPKHSVQRTWGDLNLQAEREHSQYFFEAANIGRLRQMFDLYEQEAAASLEAGLMLPAYDYVLKTSHTFNVLDSRGAIGVTERQAYFRRMRALASRVAEAYVAERHRREYPWLPDAMSATLSETKGRRTVRKTKLAGPNKPADFLMEIGTEELPPAEIEQALSYYQEIFRSQVFDVRNLAYKNFKVMATPRRIVVSAEALEHEKIVSFPLEKGPSVKVAYDPLGQPTKALEGWAKQKGIDIDKVDRAEIDGGTYVVKKRDPELVRTVDMLVHVLPAYASQIKFENSMRWNSSKATFSRPIRWILALYGDEVIPLEYAGLTSDSFTRGLRLSKNGTIKVRSPKDYFAQIEKHGIILDFEERRAAIHSQVTALAKKVGGRVPEDAELLAEVTNLVETPTAILGEFDETFLELPREVLVAVMKKHQRYFPVERNGKLLNKFIVVGNGIFDVKAVTAGNEAVLRARFADAAYFIRRDRETQLGDFVEKLHNLTFQQKLGSMWDKTQRIQGLVEQIGSALGMSAEEQAIAARAAALCKADLASRMVVEMTSLQGVMGKYYALESGEKPQVAEAIDEHYFPRFAGDAAPKAKAGLAVGIADRLDTLTGLFGVGLAPTGAKDPFAQRRAAIGLVQSLIAWNLDFDLRQGIAWAAERQPISVKEQAQQETLDFIIERLRALLLEDGNRHDVVDAIIHAQGRNPAATKLAVKELSDYVQTPGWSPMLAAYARCVRITRDLKQAYSVDEESLHGLDMEMLKQIRLAEAGKKDSKSVAYFFKAFIPMISVITNYFEKVLVMDEDEEVRGNRLGLLQRVVKLADGVADFSKLEGF